MEQVDTVATAAALAPELGATPVPVLARVAPTPRRKRLLDLAIAVPAAVVTLPITAVIAAGCALAYRQHPIFSQPRLGHGGREFRITKVRTLPRIAPDTADKYQLQALRLPRFANRVRYRHLDELPQLWHVIAGHMSLVGPRPEMPTLSASFDARFVAERLAVRPGCTGLWQISTASRRLIGETPEFDLHYVRNWTLRLDVWILMRTLPAMLAHREIAELGEIPRWTGARPR